MNSWYLQFVFAMVLVINGILCDSEMLHCEYSGNDGTETLTVAADNDDDDDDDDEDVLPKVSLDVNASITCTSDVRESEDFSFKIECPAEWRILLQISSIDRDIVVEAFDHDGEGEHSISSENHPSNYLLFILSKNDIFEIKATYSNNRMRNRTFMLSVWTVKVIEQIDPDPDSACKVNQASKGPRKLELSCTTNSFYDYDIALISLDDGDEGSFTVICREFDVSYPPSSMRAACSRTSSTLQVELTLVGNVDVSEINLGRIFFLRYAPDPSVGSRSGKSNTASIVVPIVVVVVAVFLIVALAATIWRNRRNKQASAHAENVSTHNGPYLHNHVSSEEGDATDKSPRYVTSNAGPERDGTVALNIRSTVNQNEGTVVYNEIGEQDYNTLFSGKEKDNYHEYNVPDLPQGKTSVGRTTASGSGPYQELLQDGIRAVAAVNRSTGVTGPRHGGADDRHDYQDLRQDKRSVSGVNPNGEMPNKLRSKDTPATDNGYQALKTTTPEYATLEPSPEYATLEQNDESMTGTSDVSGPPSDKQYDTLQRSINTVGQPPSAGYGTLKPMNEADADYESPNVKPKTTSDFDDATRPTEALPNNQPKARHSVSYDDDDYQTPIKPAEDLMNAYQTLDNPGYQQEPDTQDEEYSHLQRSLGAKPRSHPSSNQDNSDSYGKLHLNGTP